MTRLAYRRSSLGLWIPDTVSPVPVLGAELLTDPGLEANYTAGKCDTLNKAGAPTLSQSADVHEGSKAQQGLPTTDADNLKWPSITPVAGTWYQASLWAKRTGGASSAQTPVLGQGGSYNYFSPLGIVSAAYVQHLITYRSVSTTNLVLYAWWVDTPGGYNTVIVDDGSLKAIAATSLYGGGGAVSFRDGSFQGNLTLQAKTRMGIALLNDACTLGVIAYHDGTSAHLYRIGTEPNAISGAAAYAAGRTIKIVRSGDTFQLWYHGAQIGADTVIAGLPNLTQFKWFSTYASNSGANLSAVAA